MYGEQQLAVLAVITCSVRSINFGTTSVGNADHLTLPLAFALVLGQSATSHFALLYFDTYLYSDRRNHSCVHASASGQQQQGIAAQPLCFDPTGVGELVFAAAALAAFAELGRVFDTSEAFSNG